MKKQLLLILIILSSLAGYSQTPVTPQWKSGVGYILNFYPGKSPSGYDTLAYLATHRLLFKLKADSVNNDGYVTQYGLTHNAHTFLNGITVGGANNVQIGGTDIISSFGGNIHFGSGTVTYKATNHNFTDLSNNVYLSLGNGSDSPLSYAPHLEVWKKPALPNDVVNKRSMDSVLAGDFVHKTGTESIGGLKTFTNIVTFPTGKWDFTGIATDVFRRFTVDRTTLFMPASDNSLSNSLIVQAALNPASGNENRFRSGNLKNMVSYRDSLEIADGVLQDYSTLSLEGVINNTSGNAGNIYSGIRDSVKLTGTTNYAFLRSYRNSGNGYFIQSLGTAPSMFNGAVTSKANITATNGTDAALLTPSGTMVFQKNGFTSVINADLLTSDHFDLELPNQGGVLAVTSDLTSKLNISDTTYKRATTAQEKIIAAAGSEFYPLPINAPAALQPTIVAINTVNPITSPVSITKDDAKIQVTRGAVVQLGGGFPDNGFNKPSYVTSANTAPQIALTIGVNGNQFGFYIKGTGSRYRIWVNNQLVTGLLTMPNDGNLYYQVITFATTDKRVITIEGATGFAYGAMYTNTAGSFYAVNWNYPSKYLFIGDSIVEGTGTSPFLGFSDLAGQMLTGYAGNAISSGSGGTGYNTSGGIGGRVRFVNRVNTDVIPFAPNVVFIAGGINDTLTYNNPTSVANFKAVVLLTVDSIRHQLPNAKVVLIGPHWPGSQVSQMRDTVNACIQQVAALRNLVYINQKGWITGTGNAGAPNGTGNADWYTSSDGTHPTTLGHAYIADRVVRDYLYQSGIALRRNEVPIIGVDGRIDNNLIPSALTPTSLTTTGAVAIGGALTWTGFTQGSIPFAGASGAFAQNNSKLFWDNTNFRLGLNTASPGSLLTLGNGGTTATRPQINFNDNTNATTNGTLISLAVTGNDLITGSAANDMVFRNASSGWIWALGGTTTRMKLSSAGILTLPAYATAGVLHNDVTTGLVTSSLIATADLGASLSLTTPNINVATATSINKVAITAPATSATLTIANGKTLTANNSITLAGTDATTMTFPATSASIARTDAAQTFTGVQSFSSNPVFNTSSVAGQLWVATNSAGGGNWSTTRDNILPISANYGIATSDFNGKGELDIYADATPGGIAVTLPNASAMANGGQTYKLTVFKKDSSVNAVTISGNANINGAATYVLSLQWNSVTIYSDGTIYYAK